jgi:hypothetical protein
MKTHEADPMLRLLAALDQYHEHVTDETGDGYRSFAEARDWFESRDATDPLGFEHACVQLGLDPERIRATLERRRAEAIGRPVRGRARKR